MCVDIQFADAAGTVLDTVMGNAATPVIGSWTRSVAGNTTQVLAPAGTTQARIRLRYLQALVGEVVQVDAVQLEPMFPLPAYGNTGGSGTSSLTIHGGWGPGLTTAATTVDQYTRRQSIRYPAVSELNSTWGALGATTDAVLEGSFLVTVGGTGLTAQRIELEMAQRVVDAANATRIVAANATFARVDG
jgi:hypothetical protein